MSINAKGKGLSWAHPGEALIHLRWPIDGHLSAPSRAELS